MTLEYKLSIAFQSKCIEIIQELIKLDIKAYQKKDTNYKKIIIIEIHDNSTYQDVLELGALCATLECQ